MRKRQKTSDPVRENIKILYNSIYYLLAAIYKPSMHAIYNNKTDNSPHAIPKNSFYSIKFPCNKFPALGEPCSFFYKCIGRTKRAAAILYSPSERRMKTEFGKKIDYSKAA